jgi:hypothetical protein
MIWYQTVGEFMSGSSNSTVTLVNAIAVVLVLIMGGVLLVGVLGTARDQGSRTMKNTTQVRGITQGLITYGSGNKEYYPGLNSKGEVMDVSVEHRFRVMMGENYFTGDYAISPLETKTAWTTGAVSSDNYSYAMLQVDGEAGKKVSAGRGDEWRQTINTQAVVLTDRNIGSDAGANIQSIHTPSPGSWQGSVGRNDGSAAFETTHLLDTRYGKTGPLNIDDNLFESAGMDDAFMIYTGD